MRTPFRLTLDWVGALISNLAPEQSALPTPCSKWNVHDLLRHIVGVVHRVATIGQGQNPFSVPSVIEAGLEADWPSLFAAAETELWEVWNDDSVLDQTLTVPPGLQVDGSTALAHYVTELLVHGWDLAVATGQPLEGPTAVAEVALDAARQHISDHPRGGPIPFGPVQPSPPGSGPTTALAAWLGRRVPA
ncbi:MAG: TIGR03086 family protein [Propionibacteriaceae bacterium]|jgi:uncharacterized protein (TIGR03086 family)|nr:TIGR03086 family protein [Propionibacteriaceae bacterium]